MLNHWLLSPLWQSTFAFLTAALISFLFGGACIRKLRSWKVGQVVRDDGPQTHLEKTGTPTMGGVLIIFSLLVSTLLWANLHQPGIWLVLCVTLGFTVIGGIDDARKLIFKHPKGMPARWKYFWQSLIALVSMLVWYVMTTHDLMVFPFFRQTAFHWGGFYVVLGYFVIVGSSNAVNLTDGLDGLASLCVMIVCLGLVVVALYARLDTAYLGVFCAAMAGSCLGFLWFNMYPAQVFMGDIGSLALGAALGAVVMLLYQPFLLLVMGGVFVIETLSVIIQVGYFKYSGGKRVFLMAPLHHHFEKKGWPEPKVMMRFSLVTLLLTVVGVISANLQF